MEKRLAVAEAAAAANRAAAAKLDVRLRIIYARLDALAARSEAGHTAAATKQQQPIATISSCAGTAVAADAAPQDSAPPAPPLQSPFAPDGTWPEQAAFQKYVRDLKLSGGCTLDVTPANILTYSCSSAMVDRDLEATLPAAACAAVKSVLQQQHSLQNAFQVRRELCNFKKVCLNIFQEGKLIEKDLRQLAAFFFVDQITFGSETPEHKQYSELCKQLMLLKGALEAVFDSRNWSKQICALPRYGFIYIYIYIFFYNSTTLVDCPTPSVLSRGYTLLSNAC